MKIRKISVIGVLIIVSLVVIGIAVVNSWKKTPYQGMIHGFVGMDRLFDK